MLRPPLFGNAMVWAVRRSALGTVIGMPYYFMPNLDRFRGSIFGQNNMGYCSPQIWLLDCSTSFCWKLMHKKSMDLHSQSYLSHICFCVWHICWHMPGAVFLLIHVNTLYYMYFVLGIYLTYTPAYTPNTESRNINFAAEISDLSCVGCADCTKSYTSQSPHHPFP